MNKLIVRAYHDLEKVEVTGHFDGHEFVSDTHTIDDLYEFNYIRTYVDDDVTKHMPSRFFGDLQKKLESEYIRIFGEVVQGSLF